MKFSDAIPDSIGKVVTISGRNSRPEFWCFAPIFASLLLLRRNISNFALSAVFIFGLCFLAQMSDAGPNQFGPNQHGVSA